MHKLITGYDGSAQGEDALALTRTVAQLIEAEPIVVGVVTWPTYLMSGPELEQAIQLEMGSLLERAAERLEGLGPSTRAVHSRSVGAALSAAAAEAKAAAIIIGPSHRGPVGRAALGSVGTSLIHGAPCAVAVARHGLASEAKLHVLKVGVAFDGSQESWSALEAATVMARRAGASVTVLTVADLPTYGLASAWDALTAQEVMDAERADKQRVLELALAGTPEGLPVEGRLMSGAAASLLAEASNEFDLLVVGSRGYGPLGRTFLGGVSTQLIHTATCPVLVLPRGATVEAFRGRRPHVAPAAVTA